MPWEVTPRIFAVSIWRPPGRIAPGGAKAARTPGTALGAPHTTT